MTKTEKITAAAQSTGVDITGWSENDIGSYCRQAAADWYLSDYGEAEYSDVFRSNGPAIEASLVAAVIRHSIKFGEREDDLTAASIMVRVTAKLAKERAGELAMVEQAEAKADRGTCRRCNLENVLLYDECCLTGCDGIDEIENVVEPEDEHNYDPR